MKSILKGENFLGQLKKKCTKLPNFDFIATVFLRVRRLQIAKTAFYESAKHKKHGKEVKKLFYFASVDKIKAKVTFCRRV